MNKTLTKAGAIGLAAATIIAGLSFGPAAASAAPGPAADTTSSTVQLIFKSGSRFLAPSYAVTTGDGQPGNAYKYTYSTTYNTLAAAKAAAVSYTPRATADGWFNLVMPSGSCAAVSHMAYGTTGSYLSQAGGSCNAAGAKWKTVDGKLVNGATPTQFFGRTFSSIFTVNYIRSYYYGLIGTSASGYELAEGADLLQPFSGRVESFDRRARTADLTGQASPGAQVFVNGEAAGEASPEGRWSHTVLRLKLGKQTLTLTQQEGGVQTAETTVEVDLAVAPVIADVSFGSDPTTPATISGTAEPGAAIDVLDADGTPIKAASADPMTGVWSTTVPAPNAAGIQTYTVQQVIDGETNGPITVTADFGAPVSIETPANDSEHAGGAIRFQGRGVAGGQVALRKDGKADVVDTATVGTNAIWTIDGVAVTDKRATYTATQTGKGNNVTTSTVTLNPEAEGETRPFELTAPKDGETLTAPDNQVAFTGVGTTGDTVDIVNAYNGRVIATTTIGDDGTWSRTGSVGFGVQNLKAVVTRAGVPTEHPFTITLQASAGVVQPFALSDPKDGDTVIAPTNQVTFTGTGTTGDTVAIVNTFNGRVVATTTVDSKGTWSRTGSVGFGLQELRATVTHAGFPADHPLTITVKASTGVEGPFTLVAPADASTVVAPDNQVAFSGTGTTGARVVLTAGTGRHVVDTIVDDEGNWSATGYLSHQWYELGTSYTVPGSAPVTGTTTVTVVKTDAVIAPFAIQAPTDGATVVAPDHMVTFTGTGAAGATVELINDLGGPWERVVARATVGHDGTWTATGGLGFQTYPLAYVHTPGELGGTSATGTTTVTVAAE